LVKIGAQTTFWSSGIDALRCPADATNFFKGTEAATCSDASFLQANIILFPSIFHAQMSCYPSLAAHDFSDNSKWNQHVSLRCESGAAKNFLGIDDEVATF
jgi:hypothetical protein